MIVKPVMQLIVAGAESVSKAMVTPIRLSYDFLTPSNSYVTMNTVIRLEFIGLLV